MNYTDPDEIFPVVDEEGNKIGEAPRKVCHDGKSMLLHPVVHIHLFNPKGELFLQKRSMLKDIQPGKWDTSVGGHISPGESVEKALAREAEEELGLRNLDKISLGRYIWESERERELVYVHYSESDEFPSVNRSEIDEGKFWKLADIEKHLGQGLFTTNFEYEFGLILLPWLRNKKAMSRTVKILALQNEFEAMLIGDILKERGIPHILKSYHDSVYDGLWQTDSSWGHLEAPEDYRDEILDIFNNMSR